MILTESEYYLLSELITMSDRTLAQQAELLLFPDSPEPRAEVLDAMITGLEQSESGGEFSDWLQKYVRESGVSFDVSERGTVSLAR